MRKVRLLGSTLVADVRIARVGKNLCQEVSPGKHVVHASRTRTPGVRTWASSQAASVHHATARIWATGLGALPSTQTRPPPNARRPFPFPFFVSLLGKVRRCGYAMQTRGRTSLPLRFPHPLPNPWTSVEIARTRVYRYPLSVHRDETLLLEKIQKQKYEKNRDVRRCTGNQTLCVATYMFLFYRRVSLQCKDISVSD